MSRVNPVNISKTVYYGVEAGADALAKTVYKFMSNDNKRVLRTVTRTVKADDVYGTRAIWESFEGCLEPKKIATYTDRTREVKNKNWFCTTTTYHELDESGKYLAKRKFSWFALPIPNHFGEIHFAPNSGEKLDIFTDDAHLQYVNKRLVAKLPPERRFVHHC